MSVWTTELETELRRLWKEGYSAREIGKALGVGRGCVTGKVHRLGLESRTARVNPIQFAQRQQARATGVTPPKRPAPAPFAVVTLAEANAAALKIPLLDLQTGMCRWPVTESGQHLFCGHQWTGEKGPYCAHHRAYAYTGVPKKPARPHRERGHGQWPPFVEAA